VGRAANVITGKMARVFHVRLVGSLDTRIERVRESAKLSRKEAIKFIRKEDRGRARYLKKNFECHIDDPLLYHLVLNTDRISIDDAATLVGEAAMRHFAQNT
jgi:cytidylate kinase